MRTDLGDPLMLFHRLIQRLVRRVRKPQPRWDHRRYDMRRGERWGDSVFWWPEKPGVCIFGVRPHPGDVVIDRLGDAYVILSVNSMSDPTDQHFAETHPWGRAENLPESYLKGTP